MAIAVSAPANSATTPRLSAAMAVVLLMPRLPNVTSPPTFPDIPRSKRAFVTVAFPAACHTPAPWPAVLLMA